jgi:hypothetical protein
MALSQNLERTGQGRRRERSVEGTEVVAGQLDVPGGGGLAERGKVFGRVG